MYLPIYPSISSITYSVCHYLYAFPIGIASQSGYSIWYIDIYSIYSISLSLYIYIYIYYSTNLLLNMIIDTLEYSD